MTRLPPLPQNGLSASGIMHCLHLLAEDAVRLGLPRTHLAICQVLEICEAEHAERGPDTSPLRRRGVQ
jgi:hypothetical protein